MHQGGLARAALTDGADAGNVPFISFNAAGSGQSAQQVTGALTYSWSIQGAANGGELIPVTITTLGHVSGQVKSQAVLPNFQVNAWANNLRMG